MMRQYHDRDTLRNGRAFSPIGELMNDPLVFLRPQSPSFLLCDSSPPWQPATTPTPARERAVASRYRDALGSAPCHRVLGTGYPLRAVLCSRVKIHARRPHFHLSPPWHRPRAVPPPPMKCDRSRPVGYHRGTRRSGSAVVGPRHTGAARPWRLFHASPPCTLLRQPAPAASDSVTAVAGYPPGTHRSGWRVATMRPQSFTAARRADTPANENGTIVRRRDPLGSGPCHDPLGSGCIRERSQVQLGIRCCHYD